MKEGWVYTIHRSLKAQRINLFCSFSCIQILNA